MLKYPRGHIGYIKGTTAQLYKAYVAYIIILAAPFFMIL